MKNNKNNGYSLAIKIGVGLLCISLLRIMAVAFIRMGYQEGHTVALHAIQPVARGVEPSAVGAAATGGLGRPLFWVQNFLICEQRKMDKAWLREYKKEIERPRNWDKPDDTGAEGYKAATLRCITENT